MHNLGFIFGFENRSNQMHVFLHKKEYKKDQALNQVQEWLYVYLCVCTRPHYKTLR